MSFAKYAQFYKDNGFFAGSKIKATVTDSTFIGQELILSKGNEVIRSMTIPTSGKVEFFTDESGTLTLSADNGTSTISGTVEMSAYATYEVTLNGSASDTTREAYAKDVTMNDTTAVANISYTGDVSSITAVNSDPSLVSISISGNKITMRDAGNDKSGKCSITATVAGTSKYSSADVTFNVNKLTGTYGSWEDASDEMIVSMIAKADAGEIDLADYWHIGEKRRVHLDAIEVGTEVAGQDEQDIDLVIMHNPLGDTNYMLSTPTAGNRYQPNFIIGTKDCLERKTVLSAFEISLTESKTYTSYVTSSGNKVCELLTMLNGDFISALPQYIQEILKMVERKYACGKTEHVNLGSDYATYTSVGTKSHKVSLPNLKELGFVSSITRTSNSYPVGIGVYDASGESVKDEARSSICGLANDTINGLGTAFSYSDNIIKHKGINGDTTDYLLPDTFMEVTSNNGGYERSIHFSLGYYVNENGILSTNNLSDSGQRTMLRGLAPIMFI